jgi:hypothetical protein
MFNADFKMWLLWPFLSYLLKIFFLILTLVSIYTLYSASLVMVRLRKLATASDRAKDVLSRRRSLAALEARTANTRHLVGATFYLFGLVYFLTLPWATVAVGDHAEGGVLVLQNFVRYFGYAANVFLIFFILHCVLWLVSRRVKSQGFA